MLVFLKEPMGYTQLDIYRIYGRNFSNGAFGSCDVPKELYMAHKDILEEAEYTPEWLKQRFGKEFPQITFRASELSKLDIDDLAKIAIAMGIKYKKPRNPTLQDKNGLKRSILSKL